VKKSRLQSPVEIHKFGMNIHIPETCIKPDGYFNFFVRRRLKELTKENVLALESKGVVITVG